MEGKTFGRWTVIKLARINGSYARYWFCECECGTKREVRDANLKSGISKSCGCLHRETVSIKGVTHGRSGSPEYRTWKQMKQRCQNPKDQMYKHYGARGIGFDPRWMKFESFFEDMGERPSSNHSIDRIDNDQGYCKENCRWATNGVQARNKRTNRIVEFQGKRMVVKDWAKEIGMAHETLRQRLVHGWSIEAALTTPVNENMKRR